MVLERKFFELEQLPLAEYIRVKAPFRWKVALDDVACFIYWLNGSNTLYTADGQFCSSGREALLLQCGVYIDDVFPDAENEISAVIVHFHPTLLHQFFPGSLCAARHGAYSSFPLKLPGNEWLTHYIDSLLFYFRHPHLADAELLRLKVQELVLLLCKTSYLTTIDAIFSHLFSPVKATFQRTIEAQVFAGIGLKDLAHLTNRSLASFKRDFQRYYQCSPSLYIRQRRLAKAVDLLTGTGQGIREIVIACGFSNQAAFNRLFHEQYGMSPSHYRLSHSAKKLSREAK